MNNASFTYIHAFYWLHCSLHSFPKNQTLIIVIKREERTLRHPYRTHARAGVMAEVDEVQERMKADMEAMKEQMATMMEAMMSMKKIMEVNTATVAIVGVVFRVDLTPPSGLNLINRPTSDTGGPHFVQVQNKHVLC